MNNLFQKMRTAPAGVFNNVTIDPEKLPGNEPAAAVPDKPKQPGTGLPGQVTDAEAQGAIKGAEYSPLEGGGSTPAAEPVTPAQGGNSGRLGHLIGSKTAIGIFDAILPAIAVIGLQYFFDLKMNKRELQLNESERGILAPVLQNYLDSVIINFDSPLNALLITAGAIYGSKFAEKGFTAYFDKRDADNQQAERMEKLRKEMQPIVTPAPAMSIVDINKNITVAKTDGVNQWGYTDKQMKAEKELRRKNKMSQKDEDVAAALRRKELNAEAAISKLR